MRKILFLTAGLLVYCSAAFAQMTQNEVQIIQQLFSKEKRAVIDEYMQVNAAASAGFWSAYDAYESERQALMRERLGIIRDYAQQYGSLNDDQAAALAKRSFANDLSFDKLQKKHFGKIAKIIGAKEAAKLFQIESYIQNAIRLAIQDEIPFIDEIEIDIDDMKNR